MAGYKQHMASLKAKMGVSATKDEAWAYCTIKKLMDMACNEDPEPVAILNDQSIIQLIDEGVKRGIEPLLDNKWDNAFHNAVDLNCEIVKLRRRNKELEDEVLTAKAFSGGLNSLTEANRVKMERIKELEDQLEAVMVRDGESK